MKTDFLKGLGLTEDQVSKVMAEHGKSLTAVKTDLQTKIGEINTLTTSRNDYKMKFETLDGSYKSLEKERDDYKTKYQTSDTTLNGYLSKEKVSNLGIAKEFTDYVATKVTGLVTKEKDFDTALNEFVESNPQYKAGEEVNFQTGVDFAGGKSSTQSPNEIFNNMLLGAVGKK